jgi:D-arabinose 1-dehydrogenase-like Zn-dependent alcohol dehydrogenase
MPSQLMTEQLTDLTADMANIAPLSGLYLNEIQEVIKTINTTTIDTSKIQEAFQKVNQAFNNLSKVNIDV